jgi:hypothetical protein
MAVMRASSSLSLDRIFSVDLRWLNSAVFIAIVVLFSLALISTFGLYGVDDILLVVQPSPSAEFERWALIDGRYLLFAALRTGRVVGLDFMHDYATIALIYAVSFATFVVAAVDYLLRDIEVSRAEQAIIKFLFATLFMTHGFQVDLIAWKNCFPFMILIYFIMALTLMMLRSWGRRPWRHAGLVVLFLALNCAYQPATMALFWLAWAWALVTYLGAREAEARDHARLIGHVAAVATLVVVAGLGFVALTRVFAALTGVAGQRVVNLAEGQPASFGQLGAPRQTCDWARRSRQFHLRTLCRRAGRFSRSNSGDYYPSRGFQTLMVPIAFRLGAARYNTDLFAKL